MSNDKFLLNLVLDGDIGRVIINFHLITWSYFKNILIYAALNLIQVHLDYTSQWRPCSWLKGPYNLTGVLMSVCLPLHKEYVLYMGVVLNHSGSILQNPVHDPISGYSVSLTHVHVISL